MLSEYEQKMVWDGMLGAEIRSAYFAVLSGRYRAMQRNLTLGSLVLSSSACITLVTTVVPAPYSWVKPALTALAAVLSAWSLLARNERNSIEAADLHFRWNVLAMDYQSVWADVYSDGARLQLEELREREALLSKSSTAFPDKTHLMERCQDNIMMHHLPEAA